jgi:hypothetical protein
MGIIRAIEIAYKTKEERNWPKIYVFVDIHGTILKPNYLRGSIPTEFYPYAKETLQLMSEKDDIVLCLYTCSFMDEINEYLELFKSLDINFVYVNENPEVKTQIGGYGCYDKKPYMNVLFEDKSGFDPETEWEEVLIFMKEKYGSGHPIM